MTQSLESLSDKQIVEKVLQEDKQLYAVLVNRYKNLVYRLALSSLKNQEAAKDAAQEAFFKAFRSLERLQKPDSFGSWIYSITNNVCRNMKRQDKNKMMSIDDIDESLIQVNNDHNRGSFSEEMLAALKKVIGKLPKKQQKLIELRYTKGFSCRRIAAFLGVSERAVTNRLYYTRKLVLKMFKKEVWLDVSSKT